MVLILTLISGYNFFNIAFLNLQKYIDSIKGDNNMDKLYKRAKQEVKNCQTEQPVLEDTTKFEKAYLDGLISSLKDSSKYIIRTR